MAGGACYEPWIPWVWQGQVTRVIAALQQRQAAVGLPDITPTPTPPPPSPSRPVADAGTEKSPSSVNQLNLPTASRLALSFPELRNLRKE